jgi:hypothetical protein
VSSDSIVKGIIDDIVNMAVKTAEVDEQKTKYLQHFESGIKQHKPTTTFYVVGKSIQFYLTKVNYFKLI